MHQSYMKLPSLLIAAGGIGFVNANNSIETGGGEVDTLLELRKQNAYDGRPKSKLAAMKGSNRSSLGLQSQLNREIVPKDTVTILQDDGILHVDPLKNRDFISVADKPSLDKIQKKLSAMATETYSNMKNSFDSFVESTRNGLSGIASSAESSEDEKLTLEVDAPSVEIESEDVESEEKDEDGWPASLPRDHFDDVDELKIWRAYSGVPSVEAALDEMDRITQAKKVKDQGSKLRDSRLGRLAEAYQGDDWQDESWLHDTVGANYGRRDHLDNDKIAAPVHHSLNSTQLPGANTTASPVEESYNATEWEAVLSSLDAQLNNHKGPDLRTESQRREQLAAEKAAAAAKYSSGWFGLPTWEDLKRAMHDGVQPGEEGYLSSWTQPRSEHVQHLPMQRRTATGKIAAKPGFYDVLHPVTAAQFEQGDFKALLNAEERRQFELHERRQAANQAAKWDAAEQESRKKNAQIEVDPLTGQLRWQSAAKTEEEPDFELKSKMNSDDEEEEEVTPTVSKGVISAEANTPLNKPYKGMFDYIKSSMFTGSESTDNKNQASAPRVRPRISMRLGHSRTEFEAVRAAEQAAAAEQELRRMPATRPKSKAEMVFPSEPVAPVASPAKKRGEGESWITELKPVVPDAWQSEGEKRAAWNIRDPRVSFEEHSFDDEEDDEEDLRSNNAADVFERERAEEAIMKKRDLPMIDVDDTKAKNIRGGKRI